MTTYGEILYAKLCEEGKKPTTPWGILFTWTKKAAKKVADWIIAYSKYLEDHPTALAPKDECYVPNTFTTIYAIETIHSNGYTYTYRHAVGHERR